MTDASTHSPAPRRKITLTAEDARTKKRNAAEKRFRAYGIVAIATGGVAGREQHPVGVKP